MTRTGSLASPGHVGQLGRVVQPVVQDRPVLVQRQVEQAERPMLVLSGVGGGTVRQPSSTRALSRGGWARARGWA